MKTTAPRIVCLAFSAFVIAGCASNEKPAKTTVTRQEAKTTSQKKRSAPPPPEIPVIAFTFKNAGLRKSVLPEFEKQAGVRIAWSGPERKVSLRLSKPVPWPDALHLVCQFTNTHLTKDYQGRYVLKDGYGGTLGSTDEALSELKGQEGASPKEGSGRASSGRSSPGGSSGGSSGGGDFEGVKYNNGNSPSEVLRKSTGQGTIQ